MRAACCKRSGTACPPTFGRNLCRCRCRARPGFSRWSAPPLLLQGAASSNWSALLPQRLRAFSVILRPASGSLRLVLTRQTLVKAVQATDRHTAASMLLITSIARNLWTVLKPLGLLDGMQRRAGGRFELLLRRESLHRGIGRGAQAAVLGLHGEARGCGLRRRGGGGTVPWPGICGGGCTVLWPGNCSGAAGRGRRAGRYSSGREGRRRQLQLRRRTDARACNNAAKNLGGGVCRCAQVARNMCQQPCAGAGKRLHGTACMDTGLHIQNSPHECAPAAAAAGCTVDASPAEGNFLGAPLAKLGSPPGGLDPARVCAASAVDSSRGGASTARRRSIDRRVLAARRPSRLYRMVPPCSAGHRLHSGPGSSRHMLWTPVHGAVVRPSGSAPMHCPALRYAAIQHVVQHTASTAELGVAFHNLECRRLLNTKVAVDGVVQILHTSERPCGMMGRKRSEPSRLCCRRNVSDRDGATDSGAPPSLQSAAKAHAASAAAARGCETQAKPIPVSPGKQQPINMAAVSMDFCCKLAALETTQQREMLHIRKVS